MTGCLSQPTPMSLGLCTQCTGLEMWSHTPLPASQSFETGVYRTCMKVDNFIKSTVYGATQAGLAGSTEQSDVTGWMDSRVCS